MNADLVRESIERLTSLSFARSGGPGGQNVNKVNSKVVARIALGDIEGLSEAERAHAALRLAGRLTNEGELVVQADEERDQPGNRRRALQRLVALVLAAAALPRRRTPTKPTRASRERRLASKKAASAIKRGRGATHTDGGEPG